MLGRMLEHDNMTGNEKRKTQIATGAKSFAALSVAANGLLVRYDFDDISGEDYLPCWNNRRPSSDELNPIQSETTVRDSTERRRERTSPLR